MSSSWHAFGRGGAAGRMALYSSQRCATSAAVCCLYCADTATSFCACAALRHSSGCARRARPLSAIDGPCAWQSNSLHHPHNGR